MAPRHDKYKSEAHKVFNHLLRVEADSCGIIERGERILVFYVFLSKKSISAHHAAAQRISYLCAVHYFFRYITKGQISDCRGERAKPRNDHYLRAHSIS
jgi:hypothetical protein